MKAIKIPELSPVGDVKNPQARDLIAGIILAQPSWRSDVERVRAAREIYGQLETLAEGEDLVLADRTWELLLIAARLEGLNVSPPEANRNYLRLLEAIYLAESPPLP